MKTPKNSNYSGSSRLHGLFAALLSLAVLSAAPPLHAQSKLSSSPGAVEYANETRVRAESGEASAQTQLGSFYAIGLGVKKDDSEAAKWYRTAAEQDYAEAQLALGGLYLAGRGVKKKCPRRA